MTKKPTQAQDAQKAIESLLNHLNIKRVVSVDDVEVDVSPVEQVVAYFETFGERILEIAPELRDISSETDVDVWGSVIRAQWSSIDNATQEDIIHKLNSAFESTEQKDVKALSALQTLFSGVEFNRVSLHGWKAQQSDLLAQVRSGTKTLFLFDLDFSREADAGGTPEAGINLIRNLQEATNADEAVCGLLTHRATKAEEYEKWREYTNVVDVNRFVLISKERLDKERDWMGFARMLKLIALNQPSRNLINLASGIINTAYAYALDKIRELTIYDFESMVFQTSNDEGVWEPDTLFRLLSVFERAKARELSKSNGQIHDLADKIRSISAVTTGDWEAASSAASVIQRLELYEDGGYLNKFHIPIELGDIFARTTEGNEAKRYILIAQPCDLMVRTDTGARNTAVTHGILAEITEQRGSNTEAYFELPYLRLPSKHSSYVSFRHVHYVPLWILDFCVFRTDGYSCFQTERSCPTGLTPAWQKHFTMVSQNMSTKVAKIAEYVGRHAHEGVAGEAGSSFTNLTISDVTDGEFEGTFDLTESCITYNLRRAERLCEARASALLSRYAAYLSRPAFDRPLT